MIFFSSVAESKRPRGRGKGHVKHTLQTTVVTAIHLRCVPRVYVLDSERLAHQREAAVTWTLWFPCLGPGRGRSCARGENRTNSLLHARYLLEVKMCVCHVYILQQPVSRWVRHHVPEHNTLIAFPMGLNYMR